MLRKLNPFWWYKKVSQAFTRSQKATLSAFFFGVLGIALIVVVTICAACPSLDRLNEGQMRDRVFIAELILNSFHRD